MQQRVTMGGVTHFPARSDPSYTDAEEIIEQTEMRVCMGCGKEFRVSRPWQLQCSARCRQRAYVQRQIAALNYYGA